MEVQCASRLLQDVQGNKNCQKKSQATPQNQENEKNVRERDGAED